MPDPTCARCGEPVRLGERSVGHGEKVRHPDATVCAVAVLRSIHEALTRPTVVVNSKPQPEGGDDPVSDHAILEPDDKSVRHEPSGTDVASGASAGSDVGAPEPDETMAEIALLDAIRARLRAPQGEPDPDVLEAWADWYDSPQNPSVVVSPRSRNSYTAGYLLRQIARAHRPAMSEDDTGDGQ